MNRNNYSKLPTIKTDSDNYRKWYK